MIRFRDCGNAMVCDFCQQPKPNSFAGGRRFSLICDECVIEVAALMAITPDQSTTKEGEQHE